MIYYKFVTKWGGYSLRLPKGGQRLTDESQRLSDCGVVAP